MIVLCCFYLIYFVRSQHVRITRQTCWMWISECVARVDLWSSFTISDKVFYNTTVGVSTYIKIERVIHSPTHPIRLTDSLASIIISFFFLSQNVCQLARKQFPVKLLSIVFAIVAKKIDEFVIRWKFIVRNRIIYKFEVFSNLLPVSQEMDTNFKFLC